MNGCQSFSMNPYPIKNLDGAGLGFEGRIGEVGLVGLVGLGRLHPKQDPVSLKLYLLAVLYLIYQYFHQYLYQLIHYSFLHLK